MAFTNSQVKQKVPTFPLIYSMCFQSFPNNIREGFLVKSVGCHEICNIYTFKRVRDLGTTVILWGNFVKESLTFYNLALLHW